MSLPPAKKDISDKPAKGSVIDPVNKKEKDADVDRKIRLYGVVSAIRANKYPSNDQISKTLDYVLTHSPVETEKLSGDGKKLITDIQKIVETAHLMVKEKNGDELMQQWLFETRGDIDYKSHAEKFKEGATGLKESGPDDSKRTEDGKTAVQHLRTLLTLVLTNSEVRKLLRDLGLIGRDLLAKGASKAANQLAPSADALANVDETAPQDEFVTEGGRKIHSSTGETPVLDVKLPGGKSVTTGAKDSVKDGEIKNADGTTEGTVGSKSEETKALAAERKEEAKLEAKSEAKDINQTSDTEEQKEKTKRGFVDRMRGLGGKIPDEHKDKALEHRERAKTFLTEEYFPKDRRDQWIYRLKKVVIECQKHPDYQESLKWLLNFVEEYTKHAQGAINSNQSTLDGITGDTTLKKSITDLRTILERFADNKSMDIILNAITQLSQDAKQDPELRQWFKDVDGYVRKVLLETGYVIEPQCERRGRELRDNGRQFYDVKYRSHFDNLFSAFQEWFGAMGNDPVNKKFGEDWARLTKDLLFDADGGLKFKKDLWVDVRNVIIPQLVDKVGYVPIPRIEYTDDSLDLVVENLTLSGRNLFPNHIAAEAHNFVKFSPYSAIKDEHHHEFKVTFGQIQADMRDVAFYFRKKSGFPKLTDSGLADVILGGEGITATVHLASAPANDNSSIFHVKSCVVKIDSLKFSIRDSKHDVLYKTLKPLATGLVKKQIQKAVKDAIVTGLEYVDGQLVGVRQRMAEAKKTGKDSDSDVSSLRVLRDSFKGRKKEDSTDKDSVAAHSRGTSSSQSQFKVVANKRNSVLAQDMGHPSGWVNRTSERADLVDKGEGWKSDAFNVLPNGTSSTNGTKTNGATPKEAAKVDGVKA